MTIIYSKGNLYLNKLTDRESLKYKYYGQYISNKILMDKLDEVQKFKKDYAGDAKDITYIGKSKKVAKELISQLEQ